MGKAWASVGPLVGVVVGALLARSWERKKWERENRKEECRELIKSISHAATVILNVGHGQSIRDADEAYLDSIETLHDRIFIANDVEKANVLDLWAHAVHDVRNHKIDDGAFSDKVAQLRKMIVNLVLQRK